MANELSFANLETNAGLAHYVAGELFSQLYDPTDIRATLTRRPFLNHMGSETVKTTTYSRDHTFAAASTEISGGGSNSDISSGNFQLTVARRYLRFQETDLWAMVAPNGSLDVDLLVGIFVEATGRTVTAMIGDLFPSLSNNVGSTSADMSVDFVFDAMFQLNLQRVPGPYDLVLRPKAYNELMTSIRGESGAFEHKSDAGDQLQVRGPGFKGSLMGVRLWDTDSVDADGGSSYYQNAMYGGGCFSYTEAPPETVSDALPPNVFSIEAGVVQIVREYNADDAMTLIVANYYPSVVETEDTRGVEVRSQVA